MSKRTNTVGVTIIAAAVGFAGVVAPANAAAPSDVRATVRGADQALNRVEQRLASNHNAHAGVQIAKANALTRRADRQADRVRGAKRTVRVERMVVGQFDQNATVAINSLDEVSGRAQKVFAQQARAALSGRDHAVATLTALLDRVPAQAQPGIARAMAAVSKHSVTQVDELAELAETDSVAAGAQGAVSRAMEQLDAAVSQINSVLTGVIAQLPPAAQGHVQSALDRVNAAISDVIDRLEGLFGTFPPRL